ncbi:unnamed protein product [Cunninghamella echinulata]
MKSKKRKKKNKNKHADGRRKKMKQSQHNNENMLQQISQNLNQKPTKRGQDNDVQLPIIPSKRFKQITSVQNRDLCNNNQLLSGKYCLDHNQIFYAHPAIDAKTQQPSFIFDSIVIFGSNSIRNHENRHVINHHILQLIFPNEFKRKISHLPKRMEKMEFIADYLRMNHPLSMLTPLLDSICLQRVNKFNTEDLAIPHGQVFLFIKTLLKQVLPSYIFGSTHNWQVFLKNVNKYIDLRKKETLRLYDIFWGLRVNDCIWLTTLSSSKHIVPSELEKRKDLLFQLLRWLFDLYIPKVLRTCFYITEHAQYRNRVFYYRHDTWLQLISHYINKSLYEDYEKIDINTINNQHLGSASLRFIPKRNDLRIITNMKLAFKVKNQEDIYKKNQQTMNNNNVLKAIKSVLQLELGRQKNLTGSAVHSIYSALEKIATYKKNLNLQEGSSNTKIYFSKIDIMHCFNNINQNILLDALKQIFMEDQYIVQKYTTLKPGRNKSFRVVKLLAKIHDETKSIPATLNNFNDFSRKSIINDDMAQMIESTKNILNLLVEHIKQNTVLYNDELYKQKIGISQGSCLSTLLCNLYYGHVEKQELSFLKQDQNGLLLRYVDDFLYVSTNRDFVERFDTIMSRGLPKYGCYINHQKKINNLNDTISEFPWCGFLLSTKNLDIFNDYSDYTLQGIKDSITLETSNYKNAIINKSIRDINTEFQLIKVSANTYNAMLRNIYEGSLLIGFKLSIYCLQLSYTLKEEINQKFLLNIIFYLTQYILSLVPKNIPKNKATWLILYAFYTSHKQHQQQFDAIIKCLARCLNQYGPNKRSKKSIKKWPASFIFLNKRYNK